MRKIECETLRVLKVYARSIAGLVGTSQKRFEETSFPETGLGPLEWVVGIKVKDKVRRTSNQLRIIQAQRESGILLRKTPRTSV
jgi:hypothetical protein